MTIKPVDCEKSIIKTLLDGGSGFQKILTRVKNPNIYFNCDDSITLFQTAYELIKSEQKVTPDALCNNCQVSWKTISEIFNNFSALPDENIGPTLENLRKNRLEKDVLGFIPSSVTSALSDESSEIEKRIDEFVKIAHAAKDRLKSQDNPVDIPEVLVDKHVKVLEKRLAGEAFFPTGDTRLDNKLTYGFSPGEVTFITGRPSNGKSHYALHLARKLTNHNKYSMIFSFEMKNAGNMDRLLSMMGGFLMNDLIKKFKDLDEIAKSRIYNQLDQLKRNLRISMYDRKILSLQDIESSIEQEKERTGSQDLVVFIDLFTKMQEFGKVDGAYGIEKICNNLQSMAKSLQVHMVPIVQINREADKVMLSGLTDLPKIYPFFNQMKNSGAFEEIADNIILVCRPSLYAHRFPNWGKAVPHCLRIEVGKQRGGLPAIGDDCLFYQLQEGNMTITDPPTKDWIPYVIPSKTRTR